MKIAVDIDDVLGKLTDEFLKFLNKKYNTTINRSQVLDSDWSHIAHLLNLGDNWEEFLKNFHEFTRSDVYEKLPVYEHAKATLLNLKQNHELLIVSGRQKFLEEKTNVWIKKHFPDIFSEILVCDNHYDSTSEDPIPKWVMCKKHNCDILIDDNLYYALGAVEKDIQVLLFDQPWNQNAKHPLLTRVFSWKDIPSAINALKSA